MAVYYRLGERPDDSELIGLGIDPALSHEEIMADIRAKPTGELRRSLPGDWHIEHDNCIGSRARKNHGFIGPRWHKRMIAQLVRIETTVREVAAIKPARRIRKRNVVA